jgi:hypothetical protein
LLYVFLYLGWRLVVVLFGLERTIELLTALLRGGVFSFKGLLGGGGRG